MTHTLHNRRCNHSCCNISSENCSSINFCQVSSHIISLIRAESKSFRITFVAVHPSNRGAESRTRTGTGCLSPRDFKSLASTNSAIPAHILYGGGTRNRTGESRFCRPLPYHLAMPPKFMKYFKNFLCIYYCSIHVGWT